MSFPPLAGYASTEIQTVIAWHEALNSGNIERLVGLSHPDVEVGGPRGTDHGAQILREWVDRANVHLEPGRIFHEADTMVVEQAAAWTSTESSSRQTVASIFSVHDGLVTSVVRYPGLAEAMRAAGIDETQEIRPD